MASKTKTVFQIVVAELANAFETKKREGSPDGGTYVRLSDNAPAWIMAKDRSRFMMAIHEAVDGTDCRLPSDWIYAETAAIADAIVDYGCRTADRARDQAGEIADSRVDVYNSARSEWLADHLYNAALCDEAVSELGAEDADLFTRIGLGQYLAASRIANAIIDACESEADERETRVCPDDLSEVRA